MSVTYTTIIDIWNSQTVPVQHGDSRRDTKLYALFQHGVYISKTYKNISERLLQKCDLIQN